MSSNAPWTTQPLSAGGHIAARYLRGIHDDVATMAYPERLERRTRSMACVGGRISNRRIAAARTAEARLAAGVNTIFDDVDVVLTPATAVGPPRVGSLTGRGALITMGATMGRSPFQAIFNATGQPAAVVPWGFDATRLPDFGPARRATTRRGNAPRPQHPDRIGAALGQPPASGVLSPSPRATTATRAPTGFEACDPRIRGLRQNADDFWH